MRSPLRTILLLLSAAALRSPVDAQSLAGIQSRYPGEQEVVLDHTLHYRITLKDGLPVVASEESQKILYLSAESGAYFSKYAFYHSGFHQVQQFSAYTLTADSKKIKVTDFKTTDSKSNGVFFDDVKETSFDFPGVTQGSVGTLETSMLHKDPHMLSPFFFTRSIPVVHTELKITFPKEMTIRYVLKGNDTGRIAFTRETRHGETVYTFEARDLPAEKPYADAPDNNWYATHVVFYIEKYADGQGRTVDYLTNPGDLYHLYHGYIQNINKEAGPELRRLVDSLCRDTRSPEEKARRIYGWVQQNIKYIAFEQGMEGYIPRDGNLVCSRRFGDCKDMSSILTLMLRTAGIPAWYTWIGTRDLPYTYTETPLPIVDDHMICTIRLNDKYIFLDGTDPNCIFGMPTEAIQDKQALLALDDSTYKIITVPIPPKEANLLTDTTILSLAGDELKGTISIDYAGYFSNQLRDMLAYSEPKDVEDQMRSRFNRGSDKFRLDSFRIGDAVDKAHTRLTASFTLQDYAKHLGDEWFINLNLFKFYQHEEIDYPKRKMPIEFHFLNRRKYVVVLNIPDGYQVSYLPSGKTYQNAVWGFRMTYEKKGKQLVFTQEFDNDHLMLQPSQFSEWNKVLENLFPLYRETISLQKIP
ncbi:MAG TPA: DUF3857 domain-containing protein [Puia sp.]|nr:DUF3857 domain-containing protein [Puia sp.]